MRDLMKIGCWGLFILWAIGVTVLLIASRASGKM